MNKQAKYRIVKLISAISLLAVVVVSVSFAWFYESKENKATDIDVNIILANDLYIAAEDLNWTTDLVDDEASSTIFKCVSGDGSNFYTPNYSLTNGEESTGGYIPINNEITSYSLISEDNLENYLYKRDLFLKTSKDVKLYLSSETFISPKDIEQRIIPNLNVSKDYIVGALRYGFALKEEDEYVTKLIWIPNTTYELSLTGNTYGFEEQGNVEDNYTFVNGPLLTDIVTVPTNNQASGQAIIDDIIYVWGDINENTYICDLATGEHEVRMSIWLEGSDREAINIFSGGLFDVTLEFDSSIITTNSN